MLAIRLRLLGVSHMCKSSPKHLLKFRAMSDISSVLVGNGTDISLGAFPKHLRKLPPWIQEPITVHEVHDIWKHVEDQSNEFKLLSSECVQKQIFEQEIRPFLLSRGLLCTSPMGSSFIKEVHQMNHKINHKFSRYVTCKSLMKLLVTRSRKQWRPILEYLADGRVIVLLDWINELSLLEVHFFHHGLLLAPQSGEPHDAVVCKVETDACYHKPEKSDDKKKQAAGVPVTEKSVLENEEQTSDPLGKATVASVIWKSIRSCTKLLEIQIAKGLYCKDSEHVEGIGLFLAVKRTKELGTRKLDMVNDEKANCNIMMGKKDVYRSKSPETCMAFIQATKDYDICKCRREPREMISHVNDLAKMAYSTEIDMLDLREITEPKSPRFWGMPFVRIKQDNEILQLVIKLLFRYGASANIRTKGEDEDDIEGLLPLHVAVENASMHKYLEDHWAHGDHIINLIFLLCLPEMKMFLDTTRLIAKQTDNIVDEVWNYIHEEKHDQAAILLLAAQKQLRGRLNNSSGKASLNGFDIVKSHIDYALNTIHLEGLNMVKEGKNGRALKRLKDKKEALLTALVLVGIVHKAGEALEGYIQTHSQVRHDDIVEHVSSILKSNGIAHSGESIDTGKLECYRYDGGMSIGKSDSRRVGNGETIEADKSSSDTGEVSKMILGKQPPKGSAIKEVRNMFFPYWKSVLSRRLQVKIVPSCQLSRKDLLSAEASRKGTKSIEHPCNPNKSMGNLGSMGWPPLSSESRRMLYTVASMSRKVFKRT